jgi:hypothetical protein
MDLSINNWHVWRLSERQLRLRPTALQWEAIRPEFERLFLHSDPRLTLAEIKKRLLDEYGHYAQVYQYKTRTRA